MWVFVLSDWWRLPYFWDLHWCCLCPWTLVQTQILSVTEVSLEWHVLNDWCVLGETCTLFNVKVPCLMPLKTLPDPSKWSVLLMVSIKAKEQFALYITPKVALSSSNMPLRTRADAKNRSVKPCYKPRLKSNQTLGYSDSDWNRFRITLLGNKAIGWAFLQNIWPQADCGRGRTIHNIPEVHASEGKLFVKK